MNKKYKCGIAFLSVLILGCQVTPQTDQKVAQYKFHDFEKMVTYEAPNYRLPQAWQLNQVSVLQTEQQQLIIEK